MESAKEDIKKSKLQEYLLRSIDLYLLDNQEKYGFIHVEMVILSDDLRRAKIIIRPMGKIRNPGNVVDEIEKNKQNIFQKSREQFRAKYYPSLEFEIINE